MLRLRDLFVGGLVWLAFLAWPTSAGAQPPAGDYVNYLINQLRFAHDDDDREDAAEDLGRIGDPRALPALQDAAIYDGEDDVRDEARKAIKRIGRVHTVVVQAPPPATTAPVAVAPPPATPTAVYRTYTVYRRYGYPVYVAPAPGPAVVFHGYVGW